MTDCNELDLLSTGDLGDACALAVQHLVVEGFYALWDQRRVTPGDVLHDDERGLHAAVDHLQRLGRLELDAEGIIIGIHGLTTRQTPHSIRHHDRVLHTWCALDAIGIPAALALDATAETQCPTCGNPLAVRLSSGTAHASQLRLWFPTANGQHLIDDFCSEANLFCSDDHLRQWHDQHDTDGRMLPIVEAVAIGHECWRDIAGEARRRLRA